jgi:heme-degrading monooxygenase HmoA
MFVVIFEVNPRPERWDDYLGYARRLKPELEKIDGFLENERFASKRREGWLVSLSSWRDEKALIRWRTHALHHEVQMKGRTEVFLDYRLRVGEIVEDTRSLEVALPQQRFDETETGTAKAATLTEIALDRLHSEALEGSGAVSWDLFESITQPGKALLLQFWPNGEAAKGWPQPSPALRQRRVRIIRDYGMVSRTEAPQYYPPAPRPAADA